MTRDKLSLPISLAIAIASGLVGYGYLQAQVSGIAERTTKLEVLVEKMHALELKLDKVGTLLEQHMRQK